MVKLLKVVAPDTVDVPLKATVEVDSTHVPVFVQFPFTVIVLFPPRNVPPVSIKRLLLTCKFPVKVQSPVTVKLYQGITPEFTLIVVIILIVEVPGTIVPAV